MRGRVDPRRWVDGESLRGRFDDFAENPCDTACTTRATAPRNSPREARDGADRWWKDTRRSSRKTLKKHGKTARRYASDAGGYAREHAREGGALLALATVAAAVGAAALDARRPDSRLRSLGKF